FDPCEVVGPCEPAVDRPAKLRLAPEPCGEHEIRDLEAEPPAELGERLELVQLAEAVEPVAGGGAGRDDEAEALEVAEHARRPRRALCRLAHLQGIHSPTLTRTCQGWRDQASEVPSRP